MLNRIFGWLNKRALRALASVIAFQNPVYMEHIRNGEVIGRYKCYNNIVDVGLNAILNIMFHGTTQITTWYIGLINASGFSAESLADTLASHAGWTELAAVSTYDETVRPTWTEGAASSRQITNATTVDFTMNTTQSVKGVFICSVDSGTSGTLWATALFGSSVPVVDNDVLKVTYTVSG